MCESFPSLIIFHLDSGSKMFLLPVEDTKYIESTGNTGHTEDTEDIENTEYTEDTEDTEHK